MIHTHFESSEEVSLATRTISLLVKSGYCRKQLSQFRTSSCCCALVQAICVHCRCDEYDNRVPDTSILILRYLLQCMCDLMDSDTAPPDKLLRHRALLVKEGAHEAVVLLLKTLKISDDAHDPRFSSKFSSSGRPHIGIETSIAALTFSHSEIDLFILCSLHQCEIML